MGFFTSGKIPVYFISLVKKNPDSFQGACPSYFIYSGRFEGQHSSATRGGKSAAERAARPHRHTWLSDSCRHSWVPSPRYQPQVYRRNAMVTSSRPWLDFVQRFLVLRFYRRREIYRTISGIALEPISFSNTTGGIH
jgi:hypothetical protein